MIVIMLEYVGFRQQQAAGATRISHGSTEATAQRLQRPILTYVEPED